MTESNPPELPAFRSRFGGFWTDLGNAGQLLQAKLELGTITESQADQLAFWIEHGYLVIDDAVPGDVIDRVNEDVERAWRGGLPSVWVEHWEDHKLLVEPVGPEFKDKPNKLLDLFVGSVITRQAMFAEPIREFLSLVFERPPMAFQSLSFLRGTGQPIHQDTAYVVVDSPMELAASWIALEDVTPGSGPLEYYDGSHRIPEFLFDGKQRNIPEGSTEHESFLRHLHEQALHLGLERKSLRAKKGGALIWSADLAHGGSQDITEGSSRRSLVTHYCPAGVRPAYFSYTRHTDPIPHDTGAYYCHMLRG